jgi:hypothetical protein
MIINSIIESPNFYFRNLEKNDTLDSYLNWMQDEINHRFIDSVDKNTEVKTLEIYIQSNNSSSDSILFGIFSLVNKLHIGNIRLTKIDKGNVIYIKNIKEAMMRCFESKSILIHGASNIKI